MMKLIRDVFSESDGGSFSRLGSFIALLFSCGWVTYIVHKTGALPGLEGVTFFIATLYGLGKAGQTVQRALAGKSAPGQQSTQQPAQQ